MDKVDFEHIWDSMVDTIQFYLLNGIEYQCEIISSTIILGGAAKEVTDERVDTWIFGLKKET